MTKFAMYRPKYGQIDASIDNFNANTDKTIIMIIMTFCFTVIVT